MNTDKPIPLIPPIIVDNYMHLLGKNIKRGYFLPLPPKILEKRLDMNFGVSIKNNIKYEGVQNETNQLSSSSLS